MSGWQLLFGFSGRINRATFWLMTATYAVVLLAILFLLNYYASPWWTEPDRPLWAVIVSGAVGLVVSVSIVGTMVKRLHDRDRSGLWSILYFGGPAALFWIPYLFGLRPEAYEDLTSADVAVIASMIGRLIVFASFVELGFLRGTAGPNRFGPVPDAPLWRSGRRVS